MIAPPSLPPIPIDDGRVTAALAYEVGGYMSTTIAEKLQDSAKWCGLETQLILTCDGMVTATLDADMREYLKYEAARRDTDIWTIYQEELAAGSRAGTRTLNREELKSLARECNPDPRYLTTDDDPF